MKISPQTFFNFCASHVPLLRELACQEGDISEVDAQRLIRSTVVGDQELPETTWRRLRELQILVPTEVGSDFYLLADPISRLLAYLFDEAHAATPEIIQGYIRSLEELNRRLSRAIDADDSLGARLVLGDLQQGLRRIQADIDETHRSVLTEVAKYKAQHRTISVREKFRRIVYWMDRYVDPLVDIVRPDGPLHATFEETERLLRLARDGGFLKDVLFVERSVHQLRTLSRHALRSFRQCRRELQPLCDSLRRASFAAEGAAIALERLQRGGLEGWAALHVVAVYVSRLYHVPSDTAIDRAVRSVVNHPPEPAPVLRLGADRKPPAQLIRHRWLESLFKDLRAGLPVPDLLGWIVSRYPEKGNGDILAGFTRLIYEPRLSVQFTERAVRAYETSDGKLHARPVEVRSSE